MAKYFCELGDPIRVRIVELLRNEAEPTVAQPVARLAADHSVTIARW